MLTIEKLCAGYGDFQALFDISLTLEAGETVAIIGSNGAGKSTFLRSLAGLIKNQPGAITFKGQAIGDMAANQVLERGIALVPEGRKLFPSLKRRRKPADRRLQQTPGTLDAEAHLSAVPGAGKTAQASQARRCPAVSSRWLRLAAA